MDNAVSFDAILELVKAKYVLGLTATPIRRDGQQPILFMRCGPLRYTAAKPVGAPHGLAVVPRFLHSRSDLPPEAGIQEVFRDLANDQARTDAIATAIKNAIVQGRKVLVLTERSEQLDAIHAALGGKVSPLFVLHGRIPKLVSHSNTNCRPKASAARHWRASAEMNTSAVQARAAPRWMASMPRSV